MSHYTFSASSLRAAKARRARLITRPVRTLMGALSGFGLMSGIVLVTFGHHLGFSLIGIGDPRGVEAEAVYYKLPFPRASNKFP